MHTVGIERMKWDSVILFIWSESRKHFSHIFLLIIPVKRHRVCLFTKFTKYNIFLLSQSSTIICVSPCSSSEWRRLATQRVAQRVCGNDALLGQRRHSAMNLCPVGSSMLVVHQRSMFQFHAIRYNMAAGQHNDKPPGIYGFEPKLHLFDFQWTCCGLVTARLSGRLGRLSLLSSRGS